jgi:hypothetical protein
MKMTVILLYVHIELSRANEKGCGERYLALSELKTEFTLLKLFVYLNEGGGCD